MIFISSLRVSSLLLAIPLLFVFLIQSNSCRTSNATNVTKNSNVTKDNAVKKDEAVTKEKISTKEDGGILIRAGDGADASVWGGEHIRLQVTGQGAEIEYDCAQGTMAQPPIAGAGGRFDVKGTHRAEHAGPIRRDEESNGRPARYTGKIAGDTMTLTVMLTDKQETIGTFTLKRGNEGNVFKCR
jgi:hypothetical protein